MKIRIATLAWACLLASSAQAEIYQSEDAQGNPVFSDTPSPEARQVTLPQENISDAVELPAETPAAPGADEHRGPTIVVIPDSHNEAVEEAAASGERHEVRDAEERHEVRDAEERHEVRDAEKRHEVRDAQSRHAVGDFGERTTD